MAKLNIKKAIKKPGALRRDLGAKPGEPLPTGKIKAASKGNSKTAQRARFALTLAKMRAKRKVSNKKY